MNTTKVIGIALIGISFLVCYMGFNKILNLKIDASNESGKEEGYIYLGIAAILFGAGIYSLNKK